MGLEQGVKDFLHNKLKIPPPVTDGLVFEKVEKLSQTRRSKIQDEVLVMLESSQRRDVIQSYAPNLAPIQGQAGLRIDVPDFLRGLFRLFEAHAAALRAQFGPIKRAIRFDDVDHSLYMDVKLENTDWHRISAQEMRDIEDRKKKGGTSPSGISVSAAADKRKILLFNDNSADGSHNYPQVESDAESNNGTKN